MLEQAALQLEFNRRGAGVGVLCIETNAESLQEGRPFAVPPLTLVPELPPFEHGDAVLISWGRPTPAEVDRAADTADVWRRAQLAACSAERKVRVAVIIGTLDGCTLRPDSWGSYELKPEPSPTALALGPTGSDGASRCETVAVRAVKPEMRCSDSFDSWRGVPATEVGLGLASYAQTADLAVAWLREEREAPC